MTPELVLLVILPGLVFEAAYRLRLDELRRWFSGLLLLAVPGVLVSAGIVALVLHQATGLRADLAFIVGAMVSATDPAAVVATFKRLAVNRSLATIVDGESLLNDGTGLVLFAIAVRAVTEPVGPSDATVSFVGAVVISVGIGLAAGILAARLIAGVSHHLIELTISGVLAYGTYLLADGFHLSGVIATVTAAVVLGNYGPGRALSVTGEDAIDTVWEFVAMVLTAVVFVLIGMAIPPVRLLGSLGPILWVVVAMLLGRMLIVYGLLGAVSRLAPLPGLAAAMPGPWLHVLFWGGLRGAVAVAMALALPVDVPQRALLQEITFGAVLFTLLVQATTIAWVVRRAGPTVLPNARVLAAGPRLRAYRRRYHSARVWRMLMLCRMPRPIAMLTSDAPPCVTNGSGMPVIGMTPITMPAFTTSWNRIIDANPAANSVPNGIAGTPAGHQHPPQQQREQHEQHQAADEAELLGEHREHEVGGLHGEEIALCLGAVRQATPEQPARADRDLRLIELVAGTRDVRSRVQERGQAFLLVVAQEVVPRDRDHRDDARGERTKPHEARTRHPEHAQRGSRRRPATCRGPAGASRAPTADRRARRPPGSPAANRASPGGSRGTGRAR